MSGVVDPEGFKMLVRGSLPGILENCAPDQLEQTAEAAVKALGKAWKIVEAACPGHTYEKAHARSFGGGGGGGGRKFPLKRPNDEVNFGKFADAKATWVDLAMDRRHESRSYLQWLAKNAKEKGKTDDAEFFEAVLRDHDPSKQENAAEPEGLASMRDVEDTPF